MPRSADDGDTLWVLNADLQEGVSVDEVTDVGNAAGASNSPSSRYPDGLQTKMSLGILMLRHLTEMLYVQMMVTCCQRWMRMLKRGCLQRRLLM